MKEALSIQELKALCEFFFKQGENRRGQRFTSPAGRQARGEEWADDFETTFDNLMLGKYNKAVEEQAIKLKWDEMQADIQKHMDKWDEENKGKAAQAMIDLSKIIITH